MNKKLIEYLIIATVAVLLLYACYSFMSYNYLYKEDKVTDSISMYYPSSSGYTVNGDAVEFRNSFYHFYDMDVSRLSSSDERITNLLNHYANFDQGTIDYKNESCYVVTMEFEDDNGFKYHSMIIPLNSFNKDNLSFTNKTHVYLFDGNNRNFVVDTVFNSQVVL